MTREILQENAHLDEGGRRAGTGAGAIALPPALPFTGAVAVAGAGAGGRGRGGRDPDLLAAVGGGVVGVRHGQDHAARDQPPPGVQHGVVHLHRCVGHVVGQVAVLLVLLQQQQDRVGVAVDGADQRRRVAHGPIGRVRHYGARAQVHGQQLREGPCTAHTHV